MKSSLLNSVFGRIICMDRHQCMMLGTGQWVISKLSYSRIPTGNSMCISWPSLPEIKKNVNHKTHLKFSPGHKYLNLKLSYHSTVNGCYIDSNLKDLNFF